MKHIFPVYFLVYYLLLAPLATHAQQRELLELEAFTSLSPDMSAEICPNSDVSFTFVVEGNYSGGYGVIFVDPIVYTTIVQQPSSITYNNGTNRTTCTFKVRFRDLSVTQSFRVKFKTSNQVNYSYAEYYFVKIKSIFNQMPLPNITTFTVDPCEVKTININFPQLQYINQAQLNGPSFGQITEYEYDIPVGWSFNGAVAAAGATSFYGANSANITSNSGGTGEIKIRAVNRCASGITPGTWRIVPVVRRKPVLSFTGPDEFCSNAQYSFSSAQPLFNYSYTWAINPAGLANIVQGNPATFTGVAGGFGTISLTLSSPNCGTYIYETQEIVGKNRVTVGSPAPTDGVFWFYPAPYAYTNLKPFNAFEIYHPYNIATVIQATFSDSALTGWSGYWTLDYPVPNVYFWASLSNNRLFVKYDPLLAIPCYDFSATYHGISPCGSLQSYKYRFSPSYYFPLRYAITPNPARTNVIISARDKTPVAIDQIMIADVAGRIRVNKTFRNTKMSQVAVDVANLEPGIYFIRIYNGKQWITERLLKE